MAVLLTDTYNTLAPHCQVLNPTVIYGYTIEPTKPSVFLILPLPNANVTNTTGRTLDASYDYFDDDTSYCNRTLF